MLPILPQCFAASHGDVAIVCAFTAYGFGSSGCPPVLQGKLELDAGEANDNRSSSFRTAAVQVLPQD